MTVPPPASLTTVMRRGKWPSGMVIVPSTVSRPSSSSCTEPCSCTSQGSSALAIARSLWWMCDQPKRRGMNGGCDVRAYWKYSGAAASAARAIFPRARFLHALARFHLDVLPQPGGEILLAHFAFGEGEVDRVELQIVGIKFAVVEHDEGFARDRCRALVAIHERMFSCEAESQACREIGQIGRGIAIRI